MELGDNNVGQDASDKSNVGDSPPEVASKSEFKRKLVSLQVRALALGRQLKLVAAGHKPVSDVTTGFNEDCFELVSLVHADILACDGDNPGDFDDLDKLACRVEDVLFELKADLSNLKAKDEVPGINQPRLHAVPGGNNMVMLAKEALAFLLFLFFYFLH